MEVLGEPLEGDPTDRIRIRYQASDEIAATLQAASDYIAEETLAVGIEREQALEGTELSLGKEKLWLAIERIETG